MTSYKNIYPMIAAALFGAAAWIIVQSKKSKVMPTPNPKINTDPTLPRGYRNNNPLNIRLNPANHWVGKVLPNTDGVFEQFSDIAYGYRAALHLIRNYIKSGRQTVSDIISKWAPTNENNTAGYINRVCQTTGYTPGTIISTPEQLKNLVYAMSIVENGYTPLPSMEEIEEGYRLL